MSQRPHPPLSRWASVPALMLTVAVGSGLPGCQSLKIKAPALSSPLLRFTTLGLETGITFVHAAGGSGERLPYQRLGAGCAVFDFNNDGWLDLYFPQAAPFDAAGAGDRDWSNRLYQGGPNFRYVDVTRIAGVAGDTAQGKLHSIGCAVGDWNNDGFDDLLVTGNHGCILYQNGKDGTFSDVTAQSDLAQEGVWTSATFIDYDRDGWLDLYICRYGDADTDPPMASSLPTASPGTPSVANSKVGSRLYRNERGLRFRDVTVEAGAQEPKARALGVVATDVNNDGWIDLCVTNDGSRNYLFQNDRGTFVERGRDAGIAVDESGVARPNRGLTSGSLVGDPQPDLLFTQGAEYAPIIFRATKQEQFALAGEPEAFPAPSKEAPGWGCAVGDLNLDGRPDCVIVSGSDLENGGTPTTGSRSQVLLADAAGWKDATADMGRWFQEPHDARGVVLADLDNDGDLDMVVTILNQPPVLLRNEQRLGHHWYQLTLVGTASNLGGLGSRVTALLRDESLISEVRSSSGFATSGDRRLCFGLGTNRSLDGLEIRWPSGAVDLLPTLAADKSVTLKEGGEVVSHRGSE